MYQPTVEIDLTALRHNLAQVQQRAGQAKVVAMVKADGYGHGLIATAEALASADALGVARCHEAKMLLDAGINTPVILMEGCFTDDEWAWAIANQVQFVIHNPEQLEHFLHLNLITPVTVWLKLDNGMHRLGFAPDEFISAHHQLTAHDNCRDIVNMMHFAAADDLDDPLNGIQIGSFEQITEQLTGAKSVANSATILTQPSRTYDWVRPGIILYGSSPVIGSTSAEYNLKPVMTFKANIIAIKEVQAGESVGYGRDWYAKKATTVAIVGVGYGDGYPRHAKSGTPVLINGKMASLVGRVSMDMIAIELPENSNSQVGDVVTLWGQGLPAEVVAEAASTISYTLFCGITNRVAKQYID